jgi:signal transduction histidine kinase
LRTPRGDHPAIMERKTAESALSIESALLDEIFRLAPASMAIWRGPDLRLEHINPGYEALFPGMNLLGKRPLEAFPEMADQQLPRLLEHVYETGEPHVGRETLVRHRRREGGPIEKRYYDFAYLRMYAPDGKPYGVFDWAIDVTERVMARHALMERQRELEHVIAELRRERETRDHFVALLTHDLRTPLNVAKMNMHLAILKSANAQDMIAHASKSMDAIGRIDKMIRDLLDASRIKAGAGLEIQVSECELVSIVRTACDELTAIYGATFRISAPERLVGYWSCADVQRAVDNLGSNACKYGDITRPISVSIEPQGDSVAIRVHNDGEPIAPADLPTLFDRFMRSFTEDGRAKGWGLGLSLVRGVAEAHGGTISVTSSEAEGTTFTLRLPIDSRAP